MTRSVTDRVLAGWRLALPVSAATILVLSAVGHVRRYFFIFDDYALVHVAMTTQPEAIWETALIGFYRPAAFMLFRWEAALFGWRAPGGYVAVSMALHLANAALLAHVIGLVFPRLRAVTPLSFSIFVLSPWAGEAFFWASAQFDLVGTFFGLSALAVGLRASVAARGYGLYAWATVVGVLAAAAVLSKEAFVTLPVVFVGMSACRDRREVGLVWGRVVILTIAMVLSIGGYLVTRASVLPGLSGAYGSWDALISNARPLSLVYPLFWPPADLWSGGVEPYLRGVSGALSLVIATRALVTFPKATIALTAAAVGSLVPVLPFGVDADGTGGGRLLYWPGAFVSGLYALGLGGTRAGEARHQGHRGMVGRALCGAVMLVSMMLSVHYQRRLWTLAAETARTCVRQVDAVRHETKHVYITNLPAQFVDGPYVLKSYAFSYYFGDEELKVRADRVWLSRGERRVESGERDRDPFSQYEASDDEVVVTLQL